MQGSRKLHEHEVLFQFSILHKSLDLLRGRANCIDMLRMLKFLSFSFLPNAVEHHLSVIIHVHIPILPGVGARIRARS